MECSQCVTWWISWGMVGLAALGGGWFGIMVMCLVIANRDRGRAYDDGTGPYSRNRDLDS